MTKKKKYNVYGTVTGGTYLGQVEAESIEEATKGMTSMSAIYVFEKEQSSASIFLAGPTYRINAFSPPEFESWRDDAIRHLEALRFSGDVYVPEWRNRIKPAEWTYSRQIDWENENLTKATVILFWIPREMHTLPGLTTNVEFGEWMKSGKIVVGAPKQAEHIGYIQEKCSRYNVPWADTLEVCVNLALQKVIELSGEESHLWFTADTHFGHQRTLELSKRSFSSVAEMDWALVKGWNETVRENDIVYHLGDFGDPKYLKHLKGKQIFFLAGNYDKPDVIAQLLVDSRVHSITNNTCVELDSRVIRLIHEPELGDGIDNFFLFGHIHKLQMVKKNGLNVGVDCHQFKPINKDTVLFYQSAILNHYDKNVFMQIGRI